MNARQLAEIADDAKRLFAPVFSKEGCEIGLVLTLIERTIEAGGGYLNQKVVNQDLLQKLKAHTQYKVTSDSPREGSYVHFEELFYVWGSPPWVRLKIMQDLARSESKNAEACKALIECLYKSARIGSRSECMALRESMVHYLIGLGFTIEVNIEAKTCIVKW